MYQFRKHWGHTFCDASLSSSNSSVCGNSSKQLLDTVCRKLLHEQTVQMDSSITPTDIAASIRHLKLSSACGLDGLCPALYQLDSDAFGSILSIVFSYQLAGGTLLPSQKRICVALYKKGDRRDPGNYRPIALLLVDVKILTKSLPFCLQKLLPDLMHAEQKGFVEGRSLHHHVLMLHDLNK